MWNMEGVKILLDVMSWTLRSVLRSDNICYLLKYSDSKKKTNKIKWNLYDERDIVYVIFLRCLSDLFDSVILWEMIHLLAIIFWLCKWISQQYNKKQIRIKLRDGIVQTEMARMVYTWNVKDNER